MPKNWAEHVQRNKVTGDGIVSQNNPLRAGKPKDFISRTLCSLFPIIRNHGGPSQLSKNGIGFFCKDDGAFDRESTNQIRLKLEIHSKVYIEAKCER